jgi:hypothetical protein
MVQSLLMMLVVWHFGVMLVSLVVDRWHLSRGSVACLSGCEEDQPSLSMYLPMTWWVLACIASRTQRSSRAERRPGIGLWMGRSGRLEHLGVCMCGREREMRSVRGSKLCRISLVHGSDISTHWSVTPMVSRMNSSCQSS